MRASPNIGLFLMSARGLAVLNALLREQGAGRIAYVVTAADATVRKDYQQELDAAARQAGLPLYDRKALPARLPEVGARFCVGWRWLLPVEQSQPIVVFHDSLLPRYRGFAPIVNALINGEPQLGVTALLATENYDAGPILAQQAVPISYPCRLAQAIEMVQPCYAKLAVDVLHGLGRGTWTPRAQEESLATYSLWRDEDDYVIDWQQDAARIRRHVDATGMPYPGAATFARGRKLRVLAATERPEVKIENRTPGKIIFMEAGKPIVVCGRGLLRIDELIEDKSGASALPWLHFRTRFGVGPGGERV